MVRCGESTRNAVICVRTPVAGFFIPKKITLCLIQIFSKSSHILGNLQFLICTNLTVLFHLSASVESGSKMQVSLLVIKSQSQLKTTYWF